MNREFLMLAENYSDQFIGGWFISPKINGMRAFWDGGITRGKRIEDVGWGVGKVGEYATGLWSRYGRVIRAPHWWLDRLPKMMLDGELFGGDWSKTVSACKKHVPVDSEWEGVRFMVFDVPPVDGVFMEGKVNNQTMKCLIQPSMVQKFDLESIELVALNWDFRKRLRILRSLGSETVCPLEHVIVPHTDSSGFVEGFVKSVYREGVCDGGVLRNPNGLWLPKRVRDNLKAKPWLDSEGVVVGYEPGKGKYAGMLGSVVLRWCSGVEFNLSGMDDSERVVRINENGDMLSSVFPIGSKVTFKYREVGSQGRPIEARYWRPDVGV